MSEQHDQGAGGHLAPPALAAETDAFRDQQRKEILDAFGVEPWHIGLAPAPPVSRFRRQVINPAIRAWLKITRQW